MSSTHRDDLASLKIDRGGREATRPRRAPRRRGAQGGPGLGLRLFSAALWLVPLAAIGAGGSYAYREYRQIRSQPQVSVGLIQAMTSGEAEKLLSAKGYLKSKNQATIGARVPGRVAILNVEEGTKVKKGDVLAVLEHDDLDAQLESRRAMMLRARADIEEAKSDLEFRRLKAERSRQLQAKSRSVSVEEMQQSTSSVDMGEAQLASREAALKLQQSQVREAEEAIRNMTIVAPFAGTVVEKPAEVGEMITGSGVGSLLTLATLDQMDVETDVAENLLSRIAIGQPAEISVSAVPSKHYRGRLRQIIPISDRARGTVKVKVEILEPDENLFPELVATVHFLPDKSHQGADVGKTHLFVPKAALFEEGGFQHVYKLDPTDHVRKTRVEVVASNDDMSRVESGLSAGDKVVTSPAKGLKDGDAVKLAE